MFKDNGYKDRIRRSWQIPVFLLIVVAAHWLIETMCEIGYHRGPFILGSLFLSPLIVSTIFRERKIMMGAAVNGAYLILSYFAFTLKNGLMTVKSDFMIFLLLLAFGLVCGACAGGFHERLSRRFSRPV